MKRHLRTLLSWLYLLLLSKDLVKGPVKRFFDWVY